MLPLLLVSCLGVVAGEWVKTATHTNACAASGRSYPRSSISECERYCIRNFNCVFMTYMGTDCIQWYTIHATCPEGFTRSCDDGTCDLFQYFPDSCSGPSLQTGSTLDRLAAIGGCRRYPCTDCAQDLPILGSAGPGQCQNQCLTNSLCKAYDDDGVSCTMYGEMPVSGTASAATSTQCYLKNTRSGTCSLDWCGHFNGNNAVTCRENKLLRGIWRRSDDNHLQSLHSGACCTSEVAYSIVDPVRSDWSSTMATDGAWSKCADGYFMIGMKRRSVLADPLDKLEAAVCARVSNTQTKYQHCLELEFDFSSEAWVDCGDNYFLVALYRASGNGEITSLGRVRCCQPMDAECGTPPPVANAESSFDCTVQGCQATQVCNPGYEASNAGGSLTCSPAVVEGEWVGTPVACESANTCLTNNPCDALEDCIWNGQSIECSCRGGYQGDPCVNTDECVEGLSQCEGNSFCEDTEGSYVCTCYSGFEQDTAFACKDIDECALGLCPENSQCINTAGSYSCSCLGGYEDDGVGGCRDIDDCSDSWACASGFMCVNEPGSFRCDCPPGYYKNNFGICQEIDECDKDPCPANAVCVNDGGGADGYFCGPTIVNGAFQVDVEAGDELQFTLELSSGFSVSWLEDEASFGAAEPQYAEQFSCSTTLLDALTVTCTVAVGAGINLYWSIGWTYQARRYLTRSSAPAFSLRLPTILDGTLRAAESTDRTPGTAKNHTATVAFGELVKFEGTGFPRRQLGISFGPDSDKLRYTCVYQEATSTDTLVQCATSPAEGQDNKFTVSWGRGSSQVDIRGNDLFLLPDTVNIDTLRGCAVDDGKGTAGCNTEGGALINIIGGPFTDPSILVNGQLCDITSLSSNSLICRLPGGTGTSQPVMVVEDATVRSLSRLVSYDAPKVSMLESAGCLSGNDPLHITDCPRLGGGELSITGSNFGVAGASVYVGGKLCSDTTHQTSLDGSNNGQIGYHRHLTCKLPPGGRTQRTVMVKQFNGDISSDMVSVSYSQCTAGTRDGGHLCVACEVGRFSDLEGQPACHLCPRGRYQDETGQAYCKDCRVGLDQTVEGMSRCTPCGVGRFASRNGTVQCEACGPGRYASANGSETCALCDWGSYQSESSQSDCIPCAPGSFTQSVGQVDCALCPAGTVGRGAGLTQCEQCPAGFYSEPGWEVCLPCAPGKFADSPGAGFCELCAAARFSNKNASQSCAECVPGTFQPEKGQSACRACPVGKAVQFNGATTCENCTIGRHAPTEHSAVCLSCQRGKFQSMIGQGDCEACPPGYSGTADDQKECEPCQFGSYANESGRTSCEACSPGSYMESTKAIACVFCETGRFIPASGQDKCVKCLPGSFIDVEGAVRCTECESGYYNSKEGQSNCVSCQPGFYSRQGATTCAVCLDGTVSSFEASPACARCPTGAVVNEDRTRCICGSGMYASPQKRNSANVSKLSMECLRCPPGVDCDRPGQQIWTLKTLPGWWSAPSDSNETIPTFLRCVVPGHCTGGLGSPCAPHHGGPLCGVCNKGYRSERITSPCEACPEKQSTAWGEAIGVLTLVGVGMLLLYFVTLKTGEAQFRKLQKLALVGSGATRGSQRRSASFGSGSLDSSGMTPGSTIQFGQDTSTSAPESISQQDERLNFTKLSKPMSLASRRAPNFLYKLKILIGFFQIATVVAFQGDIPWPQSFQSFIRLFSFLNFDFIPWKSIGCASGVDEYGRTLIVAISPVGAILMLALIFFVPMSLLDRRDMSDDRKARQQRKTTRRKMWKLGLLTAFLLYPRVSRVILGLYNCVEIDGQSYLWRDLSQPCGDALWMQWAMPNLIFVLVYPIGIPAMYFYMLRRYRVQHRMGEAGVRLQLGFLYEAYRETAWYFELVDMGHKLILTSVVVFFPPRLQMAMIMIVIFVMLVVLLVLHPYVRKGDDRLHLIAQIELLAIASLGWTLSSYGIAQLDRTLDLILSVGLITIIVFLAAVFVLMTVMNTRKMVQHSRRKRSMKRIANLQSMTEPQSMDVSVNASVDELSGRRDD